MQITNGSALPEVKKAKRATQIIFLVCGLAISSWAPMVPLAKDRLSLSDSGLGLLLLFLGAGAICTMPLTSWLIQKIGSRTVMIISSVIIALGLPVLLLVNTKLLMAIMLFTFGAGIGSVDVAMNAHGAHVQNLSGKHIMSSLHGLFSVGGLCGPILIGVLIKLELLPVIAAVLISVCLLIMSFSQYRSLMSLRQEEALTEGLLQSHVNHGEKKSGWLSGTVLFLGIMCFIVFLSEGAMLDWGALYLRDNRGLDEALAGMGYACFSIAMAVMRLFGDNIVSRLSGKTVVLLGSIIAFFGYLCMLYMHWTPLVLIGFILIGIGVANIVPVFFSAAGNIQDISSSAAVSVITTLGYAGQLAGPAILGFLAHRFSLSLSLLVTGMLLLITGIAYKFFKFTTRQHNHERKAI
jgi:fucose permease